MFLVGQLGEAEELVFGLAGSGVHDRRGRRAAPPARLRVAGSVAASFAGSRIAGVTFLGIVADLAPLYARAGVVVSPLTVGSGLKVKLVDGLAQGKAMVVTGVTLQGIEDEASDALRRSPFAPPCRRRRARTSR